jgi:uncharacterized membrane protein
LVTPSKVSGSNSWWRSPGIWAIAFCVLGGIALRWINLGSKVFWYDEVFTALRVVGYLDDDVRAAVFTGEPFTAGWVLQYQTFAPHSTFGDTLRSLIDHPEHPPLFYLLCWAWVRVFGKSFAAFRTVSAIASTLTFFALPLLAWELFGSVAAAAIAPMLFAFSPVHLLYAQEARQYALWTLVIVLATWSLRRAVRLGRRQNWMAYALCLALTFYTSVLSALLVIAHGVYALLALPRRRWFAIIGAISLAVALFTPWLWVMAVYRQEWQQATSWTTAIAFPINALAKLWGLHFSSVFIDPNLPLAHPYTVIMPPLVLTMLTGALVFHWRHLPRASSGLLIALIAVPTLSLIGGDLLRGSILSKNTRYFMPTLIGTLLAIAGWLGLLYSRYRRAATIGVAVLVSLGLVNAIAIIQAPTWWNKSISYHHQAIAEIVNSFPAPVILMQRGGTTLGDIISLSHYLSPQTQFVVAAAPAIPQAPPAAETLLLLQPAESLATAFNCPVEELPVEGGLFRVPCG